MKLVLSEDDYFYDLLTYHIGCLNLKINSSSDEVRVPRRRLTSAQLGWCPRTHTWLRLGHSFGMEKAM